MNKKNITNHYIISLTTITNHYHDILVGGFNPSEQYISQLGLLFPIYGKIIQMFETTNQIYTPYIHHIFTINNVIYSPYFLVGLAAWHLQMCHLADGAVGSKAPPTAPRTASPCRRVGPRGLAVSHRGTVGKVWQQDESGDCG
jgi:hypothetical protein